MEYTVLLEYFSFIYRYLLTYVLTHCLTNLQCVCVCVCWDFLPYSWQLPTCELLPTLPDELHGTESNINTELLTLHGERKTRLIATSSPAEEEARDTTWSDL